MALVTLRIVDGPERGTVYDQLATPISIGREEGNVVRLNDERVSRFHLKIHENEGAVIATDLDSTNGTCINGELAQIWEIKPGDMITIGRSILLVGGRDEIARRLKAMRADKNLPDAAPMGYLKQDIEDEQTYDEEGLPFLSLAIRPIDETTSGMLEELIFQGLTPEDIAVLHSLLPPKLPKGLAPHQTAQLLEMLQYFYLRIRYLAAGVQNDGKDDRVSLDQEQWQNMIDLYDRLAHYIKQMTEP
ncbi:MAG: FHA domain-containing protein [Planctomycetaceae bacterium]|nr:FHA domain-containing protein [Planctomycetaceae bacterium]